MTKKNSERKKVSSFDPHKAFSKMFDLATQIEQLDTSNIEGAEEQKLKLNKKIYKLSKSIKEFYKGKVRKSRKTI